MIRNRKIVSAGLFSVLLLTSFGILNSNVFGLSMPGSTSVSVGGITVPINTTLSSVNLNSTANEILTAAKQAAITEIDQANQTAGSAINAAENNATSVIASAQATARSSIGQANQTALTTAMSAQNNATLIIGNATKTAISKIDQANQTAISEINVANQTAISIINNATKIAISKIDQANQTAISEINSVQKNATSSIGDANQTAISTINSAPATAISAIGTAQSNGIYAIDTATKNAIAAINSANETTVTEVNATAQTAITTINTAQGETVSTISNATQTAISAINTGKSIGTSAMDSATNTAVSSINQANTIAVSAINNATQTAISTISTAQATANSAPSTVNQTATSATSTTANNVASTVNVASQTAATEANQVIAITQQKISYGQQTLASAEQQLQSAQQILSANLTSTATLVNQTATSGASQAVNTAAQDVTSAQQALATAGQDIQSAQQILSANLTSTATLVNQTATSGASQAVNTAAQDVTSAQQALATAGQDIQSAQKTLSSNVTPAANQVNQTATDQAQQALLIAQTQILNVQTTLSSAITMAQQEISATQDMLSSELSSVNSTTNTTVQSTTGTVNQTIGSILPPPTGLTASAVSPYQINLSWNAPSPSGVLVTGYEIERSTNGGSTWSTIVSNTGSTATTYSDTNLAASTAYSYRVSAIYPIGTSSPSNTASATTQSTIYDLSVTSQLTTGGSLNGLYAYVMQNGKVVQSGFTPVTFLLNNTLTYSVGIDNYPPYAFDYWKDTGSSTNPRTISISSNTQIAGVFQDTDLTLSPSKGPSGTTVSITGTSFAANKTVSLTWDGTSLPTNPPLIATNSAGGFNATFQVPSAASSGSHTVQATDGTNAHSAVFTVSSYPAISLNTNSVSVGTDVRVTGTNFSPNYLITLSFDGTPIGIGAQDVDSGSTSPSTITTDSNGNFVAIMQILRSASGTHTISAKDSVNDMANQPVTVTPHVYIFPTTAKPGQSILIPPSQGNGFAANSTITTKFDGSAVSTGNNITTDSTGNFGESFTVPTTATTGSHTITISDSAGNAYTIPSFTVDPNAHSFSAKVVATGLAPSCPFWAGCTDVPAFSAFIPDGNLTQSSSGAFMVNEKNSGNVLVFKNSNGQFVQQSVPFVKVPNLQVNYETNGLMGIAFDPNWANTINPEKWVYLYVTRNQTVNGVTTDNIMGQVIRYHATTDSSGNIISDSSVGEQVVLGNIPAFVNGHNGGGLKFDPQGNLVISTGDGWQYDAVSQNLASYQGKILRITPIYGSQVNGKWYTIPSSNPFASSTNPVTQTIWTSGERNPYAFDVDSTGKIYVSDTGFNTWEAIINATTPGSNGGWSDYERPPVGNPSNLQNYVPSLYWYSHQGVEPQTGPGNQLEALSAGAFYRGTAYPNLDGAYFYGDYGVGKIEALLPSSVAAPTTDPVSGVPESQVVPILYGLNLGPIYMEEWNSKLYFFDLTGNMYVLNYN